MLNSNALAEAPGANWLAKKLPEDAQVRVGIGLLASRFPDYPGSQHQEELLLPFPFISYYSNNLKVDGSDAVGKLLRHGRWELNLNLSGSIPTTSKKNERDGMQKLGWIGEAGPSLDYRLRNELHHQLYFQLPVRGAMAARGTDFEYLGLRFAPQIRNRLWINKQIEWDITMALTWSERRYHQYMYGVTEHDVTPGRALYSAPGGYSGFRVSSGFSAQLTRDWWVGGFVRYQNLCGAAFSESPLLSQNSGWSVGIAVARIWYQQ